MESSIELTHSAKSPIPSGSYIRMILAVKASSSTSLIGRVLHLGFGRRIRLLAFMVVLIMVLVPGRSRGNAHDVPLLHRLSCTGFRSSDLLFLEVFTYWSASF